MEYGGAILEMLVGESSRCTLCKCKPAESVLLACSHKLCVDCYENYTMVLGDSEDIQCPNGCKERAPHLSKCQTGSGNLTPERQNICNGRKEESTGHCPLPPDMSQVRCSSCDSADMTATACCDECEGFLCDECVDAHKKLRRLMKSHHVVSMEDLLSGKVEMKQRARRCSVHQQDRLTMFCATCRSIVCPQCAVIKHAKPDHECVEFKTAQNNFEKNMVKLATKCQTKLNDMTSQTTQIKTTRREVDVEIATLKQIIDDTADQLIAAINENRQKLLSEVDGIQTVLTNKMDRIQEANQFLIDRLKSANKLIPTDSKARIQLEHCRADDFFKRVEEILARKRGDGEMEDVMEYVRRLGFKRAVSSCEEVTTNLIGEIFQVSDWEVHRQHEFHSSVSALTAFGDGRIAAACEGMEEGLMMVLTNGCKEHVLDGVKVKQIAALSDEKFVIIDHENNIRFFSAGGRENPAVIYDHPDDHPEEVVPVCVTEGYGDQILFGYSGVCACYVYPIIGGKPVAKISTGNVCPQQLVVTRSGNEKIIAVNSSDVVVVDMSGRVIWRLEEDANAIVPAVFNDHVFLASTKLVGDTGAEGVDLTIDRYTIDGELIDTVVHDERVVLEKQPNGLQIIVLSKVKMAVSVGNQCLVFTGPQCLSDMAEEGM